MNSLRQLCSNDYLSINLNATGNNSAMTKGLIMCKTYILYATDQLKNVGNS